MCSCSNAASVLQFLGSVLPLWSLELCLSIKNYYYTKQYVCESEPQLAALDTARLCACLQCIQMWM